MRDERLYLKTLEGLEPVHGVLRRLDDDFCDPLELRADSTLGVPGPAAGGARRQRAVANAPGCGFLESPALLGFLPAIARRLLGEELLLPSLPTWWCGEAGGLGRRARPARRQGRCAAPTRAGAAHARQVQRRASGAPIEDDPDAWTVQGHLRFSQAPIWGGGALTPRPAMLRVFAIADGERPLARAARRPDARGAARGRQRRRCSAAAAAPTPGC